MWHYNSHFKLFYNKCIFPSHPNPSVGKRVKHLCGQSLQPQVYLNQFPSEKWKSTSYIINTGSPLWITVCTLTACVWNSYTSVVSEFLKYQSPGIISCSSSSHQWMNFSMEVFMSLTPLHSSAFLIWNMLPGKRHLRAMRWPLSRDQTHIAAARPIPSIYLMHCRWFGGQTLSREGGPEVDLPKA